MSETSAARPGQTNRLKNATSPYLLQHKHNPVDWFQWGDEALEKARSDDKPIFLSVGYSACHWCHVMERESFESEEVADILNDHFVSIKVDREERPDIDDIYMTAVQAMTGSGGWPMSVFLTPGLKPFYGGTYFPPEDAFGRPGFKTLLKHIARVWNERRQDIDENAEKLHEHMEAVLGSPLGSDSDLKADLLNTAAAALANNFDAKHGGFGPAPKFPSAPSIQLLLRRHARKADDEALDMAEVTLAAMAHGGIYDHLGGGFARYSTDEEWLVPHFEKMLYDNAQLCEAYLEAYQCTGNRLYRRVVEETFGYVLRDMRDEKGGFYSAEDADSEGQEGKFYIWTHDEILSILGTDDARLFCAYYNVEPGGNFHSHEPYHAGTNILHMREPIEEIARELEMGVEELAFKMRELREKLLEVRGQRVRPGLDDKVLTSWNALMITAFAKGFQTLGDETYLSAAENAAHFILSEMTRDGELLRTYRAGESHISAYLDDYAYFVAALIDLYEASFNVQWLKEAERLTKAMLERFWDPEDTGFFFTSDAHKDLIVRTRSNFDGAIPSGNSVAALALLRLSKLVDNADYYDKAVSVLKGNQVGMEKAPRGFLKMLVALDFYLNPPKEIAVVGPRGSKSTRAMLETVNRNFVPNKIVALLDPGDENAKEVTEAVPLLKEKELVSGNPAAYVCENFSCDLPVTTPEELKQQLGIDSGVS